MDKSSPTDAIHSDRSTGPASLRSPFSTAWEPRSSEPTDLESGQRWFETEFERLAQHGPSSVAVAEPAWERSEADPGVVTFRYWLDGTSLSAEIDVAELEDADEVAEARITLRTAMFHLLDRSSRPGFA